MADVLLSLWPKWCELIFSGKKTVEVRKTRPKQETPFKCYIYETKGKAEIGHNGDVAYIYHEGRGKVIGEFVCDKIMRYAMCGSNLSDRRYCEVEPSLYIHDIDLSELRLTQPELHDYGSGTVLFGWHISNLVIYDNPVPLAEFGEFGMKRPPQSWCYVKEVG